MPGQEKAAGNQGRFTLSLMWKDLVILDEFGYPPFSQAGCLVVSFALYAL